MRITNKTKWNTRDLRKLFSECVRRNVKVEGKYNSKLLRVEVVSSRLSARYTGVAVRNGVRMVLRVPNDIIDTTMLAYLFIHELMHTRGYKHVGSFRGQFTAIDAERECGWAKSYEVRKQEEKVKQVVDIQVKRYEHVLKMVKKKTVVLKRLQKQLKKWVDKSKYYERVLIAAGKLSSK